MIRKARKDDAENILKLVKQVFDEVEYFPVTSTEFEMTIEEEENFIETMELFLVCEINGEIVGSCTLTREPYQKINHNALFGITIKQEYTHQGIGTQMLEHVIEHAKKSGIERLELEVFEKNTPAINLYKKYGFMIEGKKEKYMKIGQKYYDMLLMVKRLVTD